ncbi:hypothetical protein [Ornithinibacillus bavariensis]|uniref:Uncharacterized protein n=1 Tax=Ornithinibacillus bavariensis TaxID=545502 RepID=A0A919X8Z1_9BACI|nr:hypothetical protein [Ornithinibacillus bavariensis]GIO26283.1 hypothetical protein J43TS3_08940 [Ornithinibacillus bavariensis]
MNDYQQFLALLKTAKRKLYLKHFLNFIQRWCLIAGVSMFLVVVLARFVVVTNLTDILGIIAFISLIIVTAISLIKRPSLRDAARYFDEFVQEDRVKTALHFLQRDDPLSQLQRKDAISHMKNQIPALQAAKQKLFNSGHLLIIGLLSLFIVAAFIFPADSMNLAKEKEKEQEIVKETREAIKEIASTEKQDRVKDLQEQTDKIKESEELLKKLLQEETTLEKDKQDAMKKAQLLKEMAQEALSLNKLADAFKQADSENMKRALKDIMQNNVSTLTPEQQKALEDLISNLLNEDIQQLNELTDEQLEELLAKLENELESLINSVNALGEIASLQQQIQDIATKLHKNMNDNGMTSTTELAFSPQSKSSNPSQTNGENDDSNEDNGKNADTGNGTGESSNSSNSSNGSSGSSSGNGKGGNGGANNSVGSGAGLGQGSRKLTIPERIDSEKSIERDFGELGKGSSEMQKTPDGLILKGSVRSHEEVYGQYADSYRKSVDRLQLPAYLEDVVKDYFSDLNPRGE